MHEKVANLGINMIKYVKVLDDYVQNKPVYITNDTHRPILVQNNSIRV